MQNDGSGSSHLEKVAVYTALIGNKERLQELSFAPDTKQGIDYFCFTDNPISSETWHVVNVDPRIPGDPIRSARYLKFHGHPSLAGYEKTLWIDNRIRLRRPPHEIFGLLPEDVDLAIAPHDHRDTLLDEFMEVLRLRKDDAFSVRSMMNFYRNYFPELLAEKPFTTTMLLRRNSEQVEKFFKLWWELVLRFSRRDQLSLNYALKHSGTSVSPLPFGISGSPHHDYIPLSKLRGPDVRQEALNPGGFRVLLDLAVYSSVLRKLRLAWRAIRKIRG